MNRASRRAFVLFLAVALAECGSGAPDGPTRPADAGGQDASFLVDDTGARFGAPRFDAEDDVPTIAVRLDGVALPDLLPVEDARAADGSAARYEGWRRACAERLAAIPAGACGVELAPLLGPAPCGDAGARVATDCLLLCLEGAARCDLLAHHVRSCVCRTACGLPCVPACGADEAVCDDGACVAAAGFCDGVPDCFDGSDEAARCAGTCDAGRFACGSGECLPADVECDAFAQCGDASDEHAGCVAPCLAAGGWGCRDGRCVPAPFRCDGEADCADGGDEAVCDCAAGQVAAPDGCVEGAWPVAWGDVRVSETGGAGDARWIELWGAPGADHELAGCVLWSASAGLALTLPAAALPAGGRVLLADGAVPDGATPVPGLAAVLAAGDPALHCDGVPIAALELGGLGAAPDLPVWVPEDELGRDDAPLCVGAPAAGAGSPGGTPGAANWGGLCDAPCGAGAVCDPCDGTCGCRAGFEGEDCSHCEAGRVLVGGACVAGAHPVAGEALLTEVLPGVAGAGWLEVLAAADHRIELGGCRVEVARDPSAPEVVPIDVPLALAPGGFGLVGAAVAVPPGVPVAASELPPLDAGDLDVTLSCDGVAIDAVRVPLDRGPCGACAWKRSPDAYGPHAATLSRSWCAESGDVVATPGVGAAAGLCDAAACSADLACSPCDGACVCAGGRVGERCDRCPDGFVLLDDACRPVPWPEVGGVRVTEVLWSCPGGDGTDTAWIELRNTGGASVNLAGCLVISAGAPVGALDWLPLAPGARAVEVVGDGTRCVPPVGVRDLPASARLAAPLALVCGDREVDAVSERAAAPADCRAEDHVEPARRAADPEEYAPGCFGSPGE